MAEETVNQEAAAPETSPAEDTATQPARTFTQAEVDAIIGDRLTRERAKYQDYEDLKQRAAAAETTSAELQTQKAKAAELQAKLNALQKDIEARNARDKVSAETGVPSCALDMAMGGSDYFEAMKHNIDTLKEALQ